MSQYSLIAVEGFSKEEKLKRVTFSYSIDTPYKFYRGVTDEIICNVNCSEDCLKGFIINIMKKKLNNLFNDEGCTWQVRILSKKKV